MPMLNESDMAGGAGRPWFGKVRTPRVHLFLCCGTSTACGFSATSALRLMTIVMLDDVETHQRGVV
ncbi:MAG: hypothetical protein ACKO2P_13480 [Planctomycetota bacterium]